MEYTGKRSRKLVYFVTISIVMPFPLHACPGMKRGLGQVLRTIWEGKAFVPLDEFPIKHNYHPKHERESSFIRYIRSSTLKGGQVNVKAI